MELHDCLWGVAAWVVNVWQLLVVIDCIVHLEMSILVRRKRGNVQTLELKQNIRLDEPKTEKNYSTQHTDAKGQIKRQTWLVETEGRVFKAEHANLQRQPWQCSFPPAQHSRLRCTPGWWWWWVTLFPPIPSSPRPPTHGCSSPALAAAVSSMPPKDKDNPAFFRFLRQFQMKFKTLVNR